MTNPVIVRERSQVCVFCWAEWGPGFGNQETPCLRWGPTGTLPQTGTLGSCFRGPLEDLGVLPQGTIGDHVLGEPLGTVRQTGTVGP